MPKKKAKEKKHLSEKQTKKKIKETKQAEPKSCARYNNTEVLHLLEQLRQNMQVALDKTTEGVLKVINTLEKRIEAIQQNNETNSIRIKNLEIGAHQMLGRHQLHSLKFEGVRGIGNTVDKLGERVDECEAKLMIMEVKKKDRK